MAQSAQLRTAPSYSAILAAARRDEQILCAKRSWCCRCCARPAAACLARAFGGRGGEGGGWLLALPPCLTSFVARNPLSLSFLLDRLDSDFLAPKRCCAETVNDYTIETFFLRSVEFLWCLSVIVTGSDWTLALPALVSE